MRLIASLTLLAALAGADLALAANAPSASPSHRQAPHRTGVARPHRTSLALRRHRLRQHPLTTSIGLQKQDQPLSRPFRVSTDDDSAPTHAGFFRSERDREAGLGVKDGPTQAVLGVYQRPPEPGIPGPQTYSKPEGRGAAGLSLSFKLGQ